MGIENEYKEKENHLQFALGSFMYDNKYIIYNHAGQYFSLQPDINCTLKILNEMCNSCIKIEEDYYKECFKNGNPAKIHYFFEELHSFVLFSQTLNSSIVPVLKLKMLLETAKNNGWNLWSSLDLIPADEEIKSYFTKINSDLPEKQKGD